MKIWKMCADTDKYLEMEFEDPVGDRQKIHSLNGTPRKEEWEPLKITIWDREPHRLSGDFAGFMSSVFFLTEKARDILAPYIGDHVEFLPVDSPTDHCFVLHTTNVLDVFDTENSDASYLDAEKKRMISCRRYSFRNTGILENTLLFKVPQDIKTSAFVTERFIELINNTGLTGVKFELVWDSESNADRSAKQVNITENMTDKSYTELKRTKTFAELKQELEYEIPTGQVYSERKADPPIIKTVLRYQDSKSDKFWQCERIGTQLMVNYGKWGTNGRYDIKISDTEEACMKQAEKLINAKKKTGYTDTAYFQETGHFYFDCKNAGISPVTSNPEFRKYCGSAFYYDIGNEYAPFGNDYGNDANFFMQDWMRSQPLARSGEYAHLILCSGWKMPCIPPTASRCITDEELLKLAESDVEGFSGADVMRMSDQVTIAAVLAKFRIKGEIERYEIFQLFRSLDRMERLCRLLSDVPPEEQLDIIKTIRSDIYCYDHDRYSGQYYSLIQYLDEFWMKKIHFNEQLGRSAFGIPDKIQGDKLAEKVYETVEEILITDKIPEDYKSMRELFFSLGCMFGQAICYEYGWKWVMCGEPDLRERGFDTMTQFFSVVSPDELFSITPSAMIRLILSKSNTGADGENDNTIMLLFNMIADIDKQKQALNPDSVKYLPVM